MQSQHMQSRRAAKEGHVCIYLSLLNVKIFVDQMFGFLPSRMGFDDAHTMTHVAKERVVKSLMICRRTERLV